MDSGASGKTQTVTKKKETVAPEIKELETFWSTKPPREAEILKYYHKSSRYYCWFIVLLSEIFAF